MPPSARVKPMLSGCRYLSGGLTNTLKRIKNWPTTGCSCLDHASPRPGQRYWTGAEADRKRFGHSLASGAPHGRRLFLPKAEAQGANAGGAYHHARKPARNAGTERLPRLFY